MILCTNYLDIESDSIPSYSDWGHVSNSTSDIITVDDQASQSDQSNVASQYDDEMFGDMWWVSSEQERWTFGQRTQPIQDQEAQERRYPLRMRQLTVKAAELTREHLN